MLTVTSQPLELRGISPKTTQKGNTYYNVNCETEDGEHFAFYAKDPSGFPEGLKKGDKVRIDFEVAYFQGKERLIVRAVRRGN